MRKLLLTLIITFFTTLLLAQRPFITTWETTVANETVTIPTDYNRYSYNYTVDWGDGNVQSGLTANASHNYANAGVHTISITGSFPALSYSSEKGKQILTIEQWGDIEWRTMFNAFSRCKKLTYNAIDAPDLSKVNSLYAMFNGASSFNGDLSNWDVSNISNMYYTFSGASSFNGDISSWDMSSVRNMQGMLSSASSFNQDISNWDVSSVANMSQLFSLANAFNQDISGWDVSSVTNMNSMFIGMENFTLDISAWDVSSVTDMGRMFYFNKAISNIDLNDWDVSSVTNMSQMFNYAENFNGNISNWNVGNVTNMKEMFYYASAFNGNISSWNVSSVSNMERMFSNTDVFNQNINNWDVSAGTTMSEMFRYAKKFNQSLNGWNVSNVTDMSKMFENAYVFNQDLNAWDVSSVTNMSNMFASARKFNGNISTWDVSSVTNMYLMFYYASDFNNDIGNWDVSLVTDMRYMFSLSSFNQDISNWDVSSVTDMRYMFSSSSFNQDISNWDVSNITDFTQFLNYTDMSVQNYDALLQAWSALPNIKQNVNFGASNLKYCNGKSARTILTENYTWNFSGDAENCGNIAPTGAKISNSSFPENSSVGDVVAKFTAIDQNESDTHTFEFYGGYDNASFSIIGNRLIAEENFDASIKNEYQIRLNVIDQDGANYSGLNSIFTIKILHDQIITFEPIPDKVYKETFELAASSDSGLPITYQSSDENVATILGNTVTIHNAGNSTITAYQHGNADFIEAVPVSQELTVVKADQVISFGTLANKTFGEAAFELTGTSDSELPVTYSSSDETVATVSGGTLSIIGAGTANITASQPGNENYNSATDVVQGFTVDKAEQTIDFSALTEKTYGDPSFELTATGGGSGNAITYTSSDETVATISGSTLTIMAAGTANITASQAGNANFNASIDVVQGLTVNKAEQTINFSALNEKTYGDTSFELTATGDGSGNAITYTSSDETVATFSGSTLTIIGAGTANITASQAGNANYNAATDVVRSLTVNKAEQTINFSALNEKTYGDTSFELTATGGGSGNAITYTSSDETVATISGSTVTIIGAGTANITASQAGNENYNAATDVVQSFTVNKADQVISFGTLATKTYGAAEFDLAGASDSGLPVAYTSSDETVATISGSTLTIIGGGTANITASQLGNQNFNAAADVVQSFTVNKADQVISFGTLANKTFGEAAFELAGTSDSGLPVAYTSSDETVATISGSTLTIIGGGTANITASQLGNQNFNAAADVVQSFTVNKADQVISFGTLANKTFGEAAFELTGTSGSGLPVAYSSSDETVASISGSTLTIIGAGTANITASQSGNANYNGASDEVQGLTVNKAEQTINFSALPEKTYGDSSFELTATGGGSGNVITYNSSDETVATISGSTVTIIGAGTTAITASQSGNANYNAAANVVQVFTVNKAEQTINFSALPEKTYGDPSFELTATGGGSGNAITYTSSDETVVTISGSTLSIIGAGTATITASQAGNENYNAATDEVQGFTVNKAEQTINFSALNEKTYGDPSFELTATGGVSSNVITYTSSDETVATVSGSTLTIIGAGTANITASQSGNTNYNAAANVVQQLTVNKAGQTISFSALPTKTFGDPSFGLTATGGGSGNAITYTSSDEAVATVSGSTLTIIGAGTANIIASQSGNENYNAATDVVQGFTVNKADQVISFGTLATKTYGATDFDLAGASDSGLPVAYTSSDETVATISGSTLTIVGAGTANIVASQSGNKNFNAAADVVRSLTVNKAEQTIDFSALTEKTYGDPSFELTATGEGSGNAITYTSSDEKVATVSGSSVTIIGAGTTAITASQSGNANYNAATSVVQNFTVNKAEQTISFSALVEKTYGDPSFELTATGGGSGNDITYTSSDETVATISGSTITLIGAGTSDITASQAGNANYKASTNMVQQLTVNKADQEISFEAIADKYSDEDPFQINASAISGLNITYKVLSGPATIEANIVSLTGEIGLVVLEASQEGNDNYNATSTTTDFNVNESLCADFGADITIIQNVKCNGGTSGSFEVSISNGTAPFTFSTGNENQDNGLFENMEAGSYEITITDANGCNVTASVEITEPDSMDATAEITDSNNTNGNGGISLTVTGGTGSYTYDWSNGETVATLSDLAIGEYTVVIEDEAGCRITESYTIGGVTANKEEFEMIIYPNPVIDQLQIKHVDNVKQISLIDATGKIIHQVNSKGKHTQLEMKGLPSGLYFIRLDNGKMNRIMKK